ncbi:MAG: YceD family protein [Micrococcales bacterium]
MTTSAFAVNVHDLMHKPGQMREIELDIRLSASMGNGATEIPAGDLVELDLRLESVHEGILATAEVFAEAKAECSRCLEHVTHEVEVDFQELFTYSYVSEDEPVVVDESIDLEQAVLDAVVLNLPLQPICSEDCLGLCPDCGVRLSDDPTHQHEAKIDSRWNELKNLKED